MVGRVRKLIAAALGLALGCAAPGWAGPLQTAWVDGQARWVVHLDVEEAIGSSFGPLIQRAYLGMSAGIGCDRAAGLLADSGIDLTSEIGSVTIYGFDTQQPEAVVIVDAGAEVEPLFLEIAAGMPGFEELTVDGASSYVWMEGPYRRAGRVRETVDAAGRERILILIAHGEGALERADRVVGGQAESLAVAAAPVLVRRPSAGSLLFVLSDGPFLSAGGQGSSKLTQHASSVFMEVGERADEIYGDLVLTARTDREAEAMVQVLHGVAVMAQIRAQTGEGLGLGSLLDDVDIGRSGSEVAARVRIDSGEFQEALRARLESQAMDPQAVPADPGMEEGFAR